MRLQGHGSDPVNYRVQLLIIAHEWLLTLPKTAGSRRKETNRNTNPHTESKSIGLITRNAAERDTMR